jgi:hypothetical protein
MKDIADIIPLTLKYPETVKLPNRTLLDTVYIQHGII